MVESRESFPYDGTSTLRYGEEDLPRGVYATSKHLPRGDVKPPIDPAIGAPMYFWPLWRGGRESGCK